MPDYKAMYFRLFNRVSNAIQELQNAQQEGEDSYVDSADTPALQLVDQDNKFSE